MNWLPNTDDWFGRHPGGCILMILVLSAVVLSLAS